MLVALVLVLPACRTHTTYEWGDYQNSLYGMWIEPEDFDAADHLRVLTGQVAATEERGELVPPGVRAHIAMLYSDAGNTVEARRYLEAEKAAFPESATFVDGLLARMGR